MDQEMRAYLQEMEARMEARADERDARMNERMGGLDERLGNVETESRQTRVLMEGMHDNIRLLAEGIMGVTERLERFQEETGDHFKEVKASLSPAYKNLDGRVHSLDNQVDLLESRLRTVDNR